MMQKGVLELRELGKMSNEYIDDGEDVEVLKIKYKKHLDSIKTPINIEEASVLMSLFPDDIFYDLDYDLFSVIETFNNINNYVKYEELIKTCKNSKYKELFLAKYNNWKNSLLALVFN